KLARLRKQYREHAQVALGNVGKGKHKRYYVSALTFSHFMTNLKKNERFMESMLVVNVDTEESYSLKEVAARTTANPDNRRVELIVRARGDVERAEDLGYESLFVSWTLPSKYHRNSAKWCGCTVKEAHQVLMDKWELVRSHFAKHDVPWFGLRVAEPHKDGTPHAHLFLHVPASYKDRAVCVLNEIACREDEDELYTPRLKKKRIDIKFADPQKDPVGYLVKYISKNVNGAHMPEGDADTRALAARAWCSTWNIKQFSQSGSPPVGLWRQIRRASKEDVAFDSELADLYDQCDNSRWKRFCQDIQDAKLAYDEHTNRYGETVKKVRGFTWHDTLIETAGQDFALVPS
ncbi:replication endonuclease, partial [Enterovibrio nigricans]